MLDFVVLLTEQPSEATKENVRKLREAGFNDEAILNITHITGFFNHINRIADALGVDLEDFMTEDKQNKEPRR